MPRIVYVGKQGPKYGKTLWEILGNLKNYGVGRLVTRWDYDKYKEPSFEKIVHVEAEGVRVIANRPHCGRRVVAYAERVFRGRRYPKLVNLCSASYKPYFRLIPRDEEEEWYKRMAEVKPEEKIYDPYIPLPPLLNCIRKEEKKAKGEPVEDVIKVPISVRENMLSLARLAREGETPTHSFTMGFGEPSSPSLYENIEVCRPLFENRDPYKDEEARVMRLIAKKKS